MAGGETPRALTSQQALRALRDALSIGTAKIGKHIREQMVNRQFDVQDIFNSAWRGAIRKAPEYDIKFRTWEYVVEGTDIDGVRLEVVFAVDESMHVTLITGRRT